MDSRHTDRAEESPMGETPEDVAVLYSWANLHGAKYRDFSASRREYRAQLRHRAAEQAREQELRAQADAEAAASIADGTARQAEHAARLSTMRPNDDARQHIKREGDEAARAANAERIEAARRAEAAALAEAAARREEREIAEASASARRQAARYAESEVRRSNPYDIGEADVPGQISDPYTAQQPAAPAQLRSVSPAPNQTSARREDPLRVTPRAPSPRSTPQPTPPPAQAPPLRYQAPTLQPSVEPQTAADAAPDLWEEAPRLPTIPAPARRPRGYRPDDASGVRQIYRGPEFDQSRPSEPLRQMIPVRPGPAFDGSRPAQTSQVQPQLSDYHTPMPPATEPLTAPTSRAQAPVPDQGLSWASGSQPEPPPSTSVPRQQLWAETSEPAGAQFQHRASPPTTPARSSLNLPPRYTPGRVSPPRVDPRAPVTPGSLEDPGQRRRRQDLAPYQPPPVHPSAAAARRERAANPAKASYPQWSAPSADTFSPPETPKSSLPQTFPMAPPPEFNPQDAAAPAWLSTTQGSPAPAPAAPFRPASPAPEPSVADTLQQSRERVASRWYALKGVFEQPGQDRPEPQPVRQKEIRTPVLAVFSLAGGVGKTSLVATLGRSLSSLGEKVLLTDTTSHGLLPFYFGASELRQGTVRTFSPPSGSTDAPIYLVSYNVDEKSADEASQDILVDEITGASRGTHRVLLDLNANSGWVVRRMARHRPTILVPVAPDMNSVISLQGVEKFFSGISDPDGKPLQIFYLLNQFDASLPLHLDVREVLRRQLGDRLLPTVIRRAPAVSEALAEGMTIVDYSPEAPVAEDYLAVATWLRTLAAPATAGFRNVRWSER